METVWILWFIQEREECDDTELLIGVYRTEKTGKATIESVKNQPGFRDYPDGFKLYEYELDKISSWAEGFVRV